MAITAMEIAARSDDIADYNPCEIEETAQEYGETALAYMVSKLLRAGKVVEAQCLNNDFYDKLALHQLKEERGAQRDMAADAAHKEQWRKAA